MSDFRIMMVLRSVVLFVLAAVAEIGGAWLVWQGLREDRGLLWIAGGVLALAAYGSSRRSSPIRTSAGSSPRAAESSSPDHWPGGR
ncbi:Uncharacterised BCR, YnfA/UPF0060 family [Lentzea albidocapillata subsp. violacea]|uniref:Uncharacterized BCR, YnfA/UPF0060 family n=1 Tax=Lentzea albidocapillata subsp. violacea TaxID=128104 RepID=A0A1G9YBA9_9PSEU|nr:Uncharacterised BCR, YnfA/UPF0060 family [Lentzea albidocapillata subsp. violacea]